MGMGVGVGMGMLVAGNSDEVCCELHIWPVCLSACLDCLRISLQVLLILRPLLLLMDRLSLRLPTR